MSIRPVKARWVEVLTVQDDLPRAVESIARTGDMELEIRSETTRQATMPDLHDRMEEYTTLLRRYDPFWPHEELHPSGAPGRPTVMLNKALDNIRTWQQAADPVIEQFQALQSEQTELHLLAEALGKMPDSTLDFGYITTAGPTLSARLLVLPVSVRVESVPPALMSVRILSDTHLFLLVVGTVNEVSDLQRELSVKKVRSVSVPEWLQGNLSEVRLQVQQRLAAIDETLQQLQEKIDSLNTDHHLHESLGDIHQLEWYLTHVSALPVTENFAWITGWTRDQTGDRLNRALEQANVRAVVHFPAPPAGIQPPMVMENPWWAQPFELFARMLGTPSSEEADPSRLLVIIVPLLFGYMFGDMGHGLVLVIAGTLLRNRWPLLRVFIGCGVTSMIFGLLYGSIFGSEHLIPALWVHPIDRPLPVLLIPVVAGMVLILLGMMLNAVQAYWRGRLGQWGRTDAAIVALYLGMVGSVLRPESLLISVTAVIWYLAGSLYGSTGAHLKTSMLALGELVETGFQLLINTLSFIRVGAFALAHAGLSLAFAILSDSTNNLVLSGIILVIGNVVVIALEGLVVSIQITRLVLFEFFIRFLRGSGRMFRPLEAPDDTNFSDTGRT